MKLVFASNNRNKILEIRHQLPPEIELLSLEDIGCLEDIPETAATIEGNAMLKADYITQKYGYNCFADDTGLEVEALNGAPGVYSARYAGEQKNADDNINKLLHELTGNDNRKARFKTVIAINLYGGQHLFTGIVNGEITQKRAGDKGFGYDPVFKPEGLPVTFAQLTLDEKARLSHRGRAIQQLIDFMKKQK
ncbi:non-canonical purine NTP pyrophosphatase [Flavobacterium cyanobacteriorum]|uniref:dITP/XTP pyrophosphatase n=1 Tax=Flavobacterium cyanobacteriorum TaxID=2022802 RepID=A0A255YZS4_9FLAO|nr:non-canonical purine NTP diphosphatase [Flavobacterium cyanobacteriorum]OYQ34716.1 non-canonical purine NTP pyrophosphatase [Flavobacterium cyanobacteriorum]